MNEGRLSRLPLTQKRNKALERTQWEKELPTLSYSRGTDTGHESPA